MCFISAEPELGVPRVARPLLIPAATLQQRMSTAAKIPVICAVPRPDSLKSRYLRDSYQAPCDFHNEFQQELESALTNNEEVEMCRRFNTMSHM
jgi:hypothetical protein